MWMRREARRRPRRDIPAATSRNSRREKLGQCGYGGSARGPAAPGPE
jgi:hypothetical protein